MNPPVLVTGGAGYIGSHVVLALRDCGWPVVVLGSRSAGVSSSSGSMRWREKRLANSTVGCNASFKGRDGGGPIQRGAVTKHLYHGDGHPSHSSARRMGEPCAAHGILAERLWRDAGWIEQMRAGIRSLAG